MSYDFEQRRAIITGASSGIGEGIARTFGSLGVRMVLTARREQELDRVARDINDSGGVATVVPGDATNPENIDGVVETAVNELGGVDIMVNCAGVGGPAYFEEVAEEKVREHMEVHYFAPVQYCRRVIPIMKEKGSGYIVNMGSVSALMGFPTYVSYSASKAAVLRFSDSLRHEVKKYGIKISVFCPSLVNTALVNDYRGDHGDWVWRFKILEVERVVQELVKGMRKGKFIILDAPNVKLMYALYRYFPGTFVNLFTWLYKIA
ncbi:MAG: SDR family NAD(P)-dependent oxidoreductase [Fidelibacterota bacterium]